MPDILKVENQELWKNTIKQLIIQNQIKVLFVGVDFELIFFSEMKTEIKEQTGCEVIVSSSDVVNIGNDKYLTYKFLKEHDLNFPKTWLKSEIDDEEIKYPCIVKPRVGARSRGVYIVNSKLELISRLKQEPDAIVQEYIGTTETEYTCGVLCIQGQIIGSIALRRYLKEGNTHVAEYKQDYDAKIYKYIQKIAEYLKPEGSCNFQIRCNEEGEPYLFEINPRFSGTTYMRTLFGFKEVEYIIRRFCKLDIEKFQLKEGRVYRYFEEKLIED